MDINPVWTISRMYFIWQQPDLSGGPEMQALPEFTNRRLHVSYSVVRCSKDSLAMTIQDNNYKKKNVIQMFAVCLRCWYKFSIFPSPWFLFFNLSISTSLITNPSALISHQFSSWNLYARLKKPLPAKRMSRMSPLSPPTMDLTHPTWPTSLTLVLTLTVVCTYPTLKYFTCNFSTDHFS